MTHVKCTKLKPKGKHLIEIPFSYLVEISAYLDK